MIQNAINQEIEQVYLFGFFQVVDIQQVFVSEKTFELICVPNACVTDKSSWFTLLALILNLSGQLFKVFLVRLAGFKL